MADNNFPDIGIDENDKDTAITDYGFVPADPTDTEASADIHQKSPGTENGRSGYYDASDTNSDSSSSSNSSSSTVSMPYYSLYTTATAASGTTTASTTNNITGKSQQASGTQSAGFPPTQTPFSGSQALKAKSGSISPVMGIIRFFRYAFRFDGKAKRSEFFWGYLFYYIVAMVGSVSFILSLLMLTMDGSISTNADLHFINNNTWVLYLAGIILLYMTIGAASLCTRRLRDMGAKPKLAWLFLFLGANPIWSLLLFALSLPKSK